MYANDTMDFLSKINAPHVLIAESNADNMASIAQMVEKAGYNVMKAYNAGDALYAIEHNPPDIALIDATMADRDQYPIVQAFSAPPYSTFRRWIAVIDAEYEQPDHLLNLGAAAYVQRPLESSLLLRQIEGVLAGEIMLEDVRSSEQTRPESESRRTTQEEVILNRILEQRLKEQRTLSTLARSLSATLDLDALLTQVVEAAVSLSSAEEGLLLLSDEEEKALYVRAFKGIDSETARNFRIKTQDTLAGQVFRTGQPIIIGDQGWQKVKTEYLVRSLLYVPLSIKGKSIGVLGVNNKTVDRTFSEHDSELLQDLAAHAAIAIENAALYEESVLRTRELSTLVQAGEAANSTLALDRVLSAIAVQLIGALDVNQCFIGEWRADQQRLETLAVCYRTQWRPKDGPTLSLKNNPAILEAFERGAAEHQSPIERYGNYPLAGWLPQRYYAIHALLVPVFAHDQLVGMVRTSYLYQAPHESSYSDLSTVQRLGLDVITRMMRSAPPPESETLFQITQQILENTGADWCEIAVWNPASHQLHTVLSFGEAIWPEPPRPGLDLTQFPRLVSMISQQDTVASATAEDLRYMLATGYGKSVLGVPMVIKGEAAGAVILTDTLHNRQFTRRQVQLAQALVLQAANALDNARLYRDLEISLEELHRTQSKLVQTARLSAMGELAAAVAHQINNPLTTVLGEAEMVLQDLPEEDINQAALQAILRAGRRALEVVRRLLTMARHEPVEEVLEALDINESIQNTLTLVKSHVQQGSIKLEVRLTDNLPLVWGIRGQLEDVWLNLLLNARDAVADREAPQIGIMTSPRPHQEMVEVMVWDNGVGIPENQLSEIFKPFVTTKPVGEGTGLGLHICRQIIEKCHGSIMVESVYNEGTEFIVRLPVYRDGETL